ncbi:hypothetical protein [Streptomyces sp. NPDC003077]|uniref:hypothetical protein n=1 Tax=Streptomyces sp. NPDC003077 TaxID=3154443 RepID=UPI0033A6B1ED
MSDSRQERDGARPDAASPGRAGIGPEHLVRVLPYAFPWSRSLPEGDRHEFAVELGDALGAPEPCAAESALTQTIVAWQHTAEAHADPELLAALTRDHGEDHGPVFPPDIGV